jgi:Lanthionine synthetase C-like protein
VAIEQDAYMLPDTESYEPLSSRAFSGEYHRILAELLPLGWRIQRGDIWLHAYQLAEVEHPKSKMPSGAVLPSDSPDKIEYSTKWRTLGFSKIDRGSRRSLESLDDFYAVAMVLLNAIVPINPLIELHPPAKERFLGFMLQRGISPRIGEALTFLEEGDAARAEQQLREAKKERENAHSIPARTCYKIPLKEGALVNGSCSQSTIDCIASYLIGSADYGRQDRLWPCDYNTFLTNPLNLAFGACGTALFLNKMNQYLPPKLIDWLTGHSLSHDEYAPGLCSGLAGISLAFSGLGLVEAAERILVEAYKSQLLFEDPSVYYGCAGWGLVSLYFYKTTRKQIYFDFAIQAGENLARTCRSGEGGCFWRSAVDGKIYYGWGMGQAGVALFLLKLYDVTCLGAYLEIAKEALHYDLYHGINTEVGKQWHRYEADNLLFPYMLHGTAGIGAVVVRFASVLQDQYFRSVAVALARDAYVSHSFSPGLFEGLAGIGEFMLDVGYELDEPEFCRKARDIADSIQRFRIERDNGVVFPDRSLLKISADFGSGSAGIGLFFNRVLHRDRRFLFDI